MTIRRVLIANRGEIAVRVIRTCQRLGIETVLAASEADSDGMAARLADATICIGAANPVASYLNIEALVGAAVSVKADAMHPGYGFLSENAKLAWACDRAGVTFIGPLPEQLEAVGDKLNSRSHAMAAGIAGIPGGEVHGIEEARRLGNEIGWPLLIKAAGGGGGRGMKRVSEASELPAAIALARSEALAAFGDPRLYLECYVPHGRHVEVQVLGDGADVIHLGTRDCSIQRRYQKLLEEAPAPNLDETLREDMQRAAVVFAKHLKYRGLGTVEFLVDCDQGAFCFLEMNARIQVEHPVTEAICGLDLVEEQIAIAEGRKLRWKQEEIEFSGHAIECRINAEDWAKDFRPTPGLVTDAIFPVGPGIRVDTHVQAGTEVPPYYDSLLGKLIVHAANREEAIRTSRRALLRTQISGVATNLGVHVTLTANQEFAHGGVGTTFLQTFLDEARLETS